VIYVLVFVFSARAAHVLQVLGSWHVSTNCQSCLLHASFNHITCRLHSSLASFKLARWTCAVSFLQPSKTEERMSWKQRLPLSGTQELHSVL